jgi:hypothetical protein
MEKAVVKRREKEERLKSRKIRYVRRGNMSEREEGLF